MAGVRLQRQQMSAADTLTKCTTLRCRILKTPRTATENRQSPHARSYIEIRVAENAIHASHFTPSYPTPPLRLAPPLPCPTAVQRSYPAPPLLHKRRLLPLPPRRAPTGCLLHCNSRQRAAHRCTGEPRFHSRSHCQTRTAGSVR